MAKNSKTCQLIKNLPTNKVTKIQKNTKNAKFAKISIIKSEYSISLLYF